MSRRVKEQLRPMLAIVALAIIALVVGGYILLNQRVRTPFNSDYTLSVAMPTAQALTPGQGQTATVAGVKVGEISHVTLKDGVAIVDMRIDPSQLPRGDVRQDAQLILRPRTPLQDMTIDIDPGTTASPPLGKGVVLDESHTSANVNLDEVEASLDSDTRAWMQTTLQAGGEGLGNRGKALKEAFRATAPTLAVTQRVSAALASRRKELARAIHNLSVLSGAVALQDHSVADLVKGGNATFGALASEAAALRSSISKLPATLNSAQSAVSILTPFAKAAGPALRPLIPTAHDLPAALTGARPLLRQGAPALRSLSTLADKGAPAIANLGPALNDINAQVPDLTTSFNVLNRGTNELAHAPGGSEHSYLFYLAWFAHNINSLVSGEDANGVFWHGGLVASCSTATLASSITKLVSPLIKASGICPNDPGDG